MEKFIEVELTSGLTLINLKYIVDVLPSQGSKQGTYINVVYGPVVKNHYLKEPYETFKVRLVELTGQ